MCGVDILSSWIGSLYWICSHTLMLSQWLGEFVESTENLKVVCFQEHPQLLNDKILVGSGVDSHIWFIKQKTFQSLFHYLIYKDLPNCSIVQFWSLISVHLEEYVPLVLASLVRSLTRCKLPQDMSQARWLLSRRYGLLLKVPEQKKGLWGELRRQWLWLGCVPRWWWWLFLVREQWNKHKGRKR